MNVSASINALHNVSAAMNKIPGRLNEAILNPEAKEGLENVLTDMITETRTYEANVKSIKTMTTVEDMILNELRDK